MKTFLFILLGLGLMPFNVHAMDTTPPTSTSQIPKNKFCISKQNVKSWSTAEKQACIKLKVPAAGYIKGIHGDSKYTIQAQNIHNQDKIGNITPHVNLLFLLGIDCTSGRNCKNSIQAWQHQYNKTQNLKPPMTLDGLIGPQTARYLNQYRQAQIIHFNANNSDLQRNIDIGRFNSGGKVISTELLFNHVIKVLVVFAGSIAILIILYAGVLMVMSLGSADKFKKAQQTALGGILGLVIILGAYVIVAFVRGIINLFV